MESRSKREEPETVYNIEVEGDHFYRVGESGVLVHNVSIPTKAPKAGVDFGCGKVSGKGNCKRGTQDISARSGYQAHHLIGVNEAKQRIMERACQLGYDINRKNNAEDYPAYGKWNPKFKTVSDGRKESQRTGLPLHTGPHPADKYQFCVEQHLDRLAEAYRRGDVNDCSLCDEVTKIENELRRALGAHEIWLNNNDPHISSTQKPTCRETY